MNIFVYAIAFYMSLCGLSQVTVYETEYTLDHHTGVICGESVDAEDYHNPFCETIDNPLPY